MSSQGAQCQGWGGGDGWEGNRPGRSTQFSRCPGAQGRVPLDRGGPGPRGDTGQRRDSRRVLRAPALPCPAGLAAQQDWTPGPRAAGPVPGPRGAYLTPSAGSALAGRVARRLRVPTATAERAPSGQEGGREAGGAGAFIPACPGARPPGGAAAPRMGVGGPGRGRRGPEGPGGAPERARGQQGSGAGSGPSPGGAARRGRRRLSGSSAREVRVPPHAPTGLLAPAPHFRAAFTRGQALRTPLRSEELLRAAGRAPTAQGDPSSVPHPAPPLSGPAQAQADSGLLVQGPAAPVPAWGRLCVPRE